MSVPVYIGDEVSASGYRLAGLRVLVPGREDPGSVLATARAEAPLVLLSAGIARRLPAQQLEQALAAAAPPVVVVPDVHTLQQPADLATRIRQQLGVLE